MTSNDDQDQVVTVGVLKCYLKEYTDQIKAHINESEDIGCDEFQYNKTTIETITLQKRDKKDINDMPNITKEKVTDFVLADGKIVLTPTIANYSCLDPEEVNAAKETITDNSFGNSFNKYAGNDATITLQDLDKKYINDVPKTNKETVIDVVLVDGKVVLTPTATNVKMTLPTKEEYKDRSKRKDINFVLSTAKETTICYTILELLPMPMKVDEITGPPDHS